MYIPYVFFFENTYIAYESKVTENKTLPVLILYRRLFNDV
jgi:hypothetical protein